MLKRAESEPYFNLANAIVVRAAKDYVAALKKVKRSCNNKKVLQEVMDLESFFHSGWYGELTSVDPDFLIQTLRKKVDK